MGGRRAWFVLVPALASCAAFDGVFGGGDPDPTAAAPAAPGDAGGAEAGAPDPNASSLIDGTFEQSGAKRCAGATPYKASAVPDPNAATGSVACLVCANPDLLGGEEGYVVLHVVPRRRIPRPATSTPCSTRTRMGSA